MAKRTITALYDRYEEAANAVRKLEGMGVPHGDISIVANNEGDRYSHHASSGSTGSAGSRTGDTHADDGAGTGATTGTLIGGGAGLLAGLGLLAIPGAGPVVAAGWLISTLTGAGVGAAVGGLVGSLVGAGVPEEHAHAYAEGVRRGGTLVTVRADDAQVNRVVDILDDHGSVDMDERERTWRGSGWKGLNEESGYTTHSAGTSSTTGGMGSGMGSGIAAAASHAASSLTGSSHTTDYDRTRQTSTTGTGTTGTGMSSGLGVAGAAGTSASRTHGDREAIPIVEENLQVGKREVSGGRVRIHSHVVETPVQEQVTLREETVHVERRPVDRQLTGNEPLFQDRTIEVEERDEQAVVAKEARVKEELVVNKDVQQRTETISDTVRRTEVEVEDERGTRVSGTGTTGSTTDRNRKV